MLCRNVTTAVAVLTLAACATPSGPTPLERRTAMRIEAEKRRIEFEKTYRSPEGFQASRWGMTPADLQTAVPGAVDDGRGNYRLSTTVDGAPAVVLFRFVEGRLAAADVALAAVRDGRPRHEKFRDALALKYRAPKESTDTAAEAAARVGSYRLAAGITEAGQQANTAISGVEPDLYRAAQLRADAERLEAQAEAAAATAQFTFTLSDVFQTSESHVALQTAQSLEGAATTIAYRSVVYAERLAAEEAREKGEAVKKTASDL